MKFGCRLHRHRTVGTYFIIFASVFLTFVTFAQWNRDTLLEPSISQRASVPAQNPASALNEGRSAYSSHFEQPPSNDTVYEDIRDPNYPTPAKWKYDAIYFSFSDGSQLFTNQGMSPRTTARDPFKDEYDFLAKVKRFSKAYLQNKIPDNETTWSCKSISYRVIYTLGLECQILCESLDGLRLERLNMFFPLEEPVITFHQSTVTKKERVDLNIITPLQGRVPQLQVFLDNLKKVLKQTKFRLGWTLIQSKGELQESVINAVEKFVSETRIPVDIREENQPFSRGKWLHSGIRESKIESPVVFICDIDILFDHMFLSRCIGTPLLQQQMYFPVVFSLYNPDLAFVLEGVTLPSIEERLEINDLNGFWRTAGYGMVCAYRKDLLRLKAYQGAPTSWGGEDENLMYKARSMGYKIIRILDPGIFHIYHHKSCSKIEKRKLKSCHMTKVLTEGSQLSLAKLYFQNKEGIKITKLLR